MRPVSFDAELMTAWGEWVLRYGLPELPESVSLDQSVPVAYWAGPQFGAVLYVQRSQSDHEDDDERVDTQTQCYRRLGESWEPASGQGGYGPSDPQLARIAVDADHVRFDESVEVGGDGWRCTAIGGTVGSRATFIELAEAGNTIRRPVEAPTGAVIVCFSSSDRPAVIRVLDAAGTEIGRHTVW